MADYDNIHVQGYWCNDGTGGLSITCGDCVEGSDSAWIDHDGYEAGLDEHLTLSRIVELAEDHRRRHHG